MNMKLWSILTALLAVALTPPAHAQGGEAAPGMPGLDFGGGDFTINRMIYENLDLDAETGDLLITGQVDIDSDAFHLTGSRVQYNAERKLLTATGSPVRI